MLRTSALLAAALAGAALPAAAQEIDTTAGEEAEGLPLRLEELLPERGEVRADVSLVFSARSDDEITSAFETISLGGGDFLTIPTAIDARRTEADSALLVGTLRYGATERLELSVRGALAGSDTRVVSFGEGVDQETSFALNELAVGASYQFSQDAETPALIGFADLTLAEAVDAEGDEYAYGRALNLGLTAYRVLDPVVLTLTGGYRAAAEREVAGSDVDPGDVLYLNPGVAFVVNDAVTLTAGVNLRRLLADEVDGREVGASRTRAEMEFGLGYGVSDRLTLRAAARADVVGSDGFTAVLSVSRQFGR